MRGVFSMSAIETGLTPAKQAKRTHLALVPFGQHPKNGNARGLRGQGRRSCVVRGSDDRFTHARCNIGELHCERQWGVSAQHVGRGASDQRGGAEDGHVSADHPFAHSLTDPCSDREPDCTADARPHPSAAASCYPATRRHGTPSGSGAKHLRGGSEPMGIQLLRRLLHLVASVELLLVLQLHRVLLERRRVCDAVRRRNVQ